MNNLQAQTFEEGAGSFFTAADLLGLIQSVGAVLLFTYVAWLCVNAYKDFSNEQIYSREMVSVWLRSIAMMMFLLFLILN